VEYIITCPYCFESFSHEETLFRSATYYIDEKEMEKQLGFSENDLDFIDDTTERREKENKLNIAKQYLVKKDTVYQGFWDRFDGKTTESGNRLLKCQPWDLPIIGTGSGVKELITDEDEFVIEAKDEFGNTSSSRVCPHCHNPIPGKFGKHSVRNISIIGTVGAGKTVYISQLLNKFEEYVSKVGLSAYSTSPNEKEFVEKNKVKKGHPLPAATKQESFSQPMFYDIVYTEKTNKITETIVLYDIAGENCRSADAMKRFGIYVEKSDGIILLIDPKQVDFETGNENADTDAPSIAINTLYHTLPGKDKEKCKIPLAVCISKSDRCLDILPTIASEEIQATSGSDTNKFDAKSYNKLIMGQDGLAISFERNARELCQKLKTDYSNYNFFAVGAIGCSCGADTKGVFSPLSIPRPTRIEEPIFWMMKQFGIIKSNTPVKRPFPIRNATRYKFVKQLFKKPYLLEEKPDFSENEEQPIRTAEQVYKNKQYVDWNKEFDGLEKRKYEENRE